MNKILLLFFFLLFFNQVYSQSHPLPYTSGWDTPTEQAGWQQYQTGDIGTSSWGVGGGQPSSPPNSLHHGYNVGGASTDTVVDWYVSPPINVNTGSYVKMQVKVFGFSPVPLVDNCEIWYNVGVQNPAIANFTLLGNLSYMLPQSTWLDTSFQLPITGDSIYIAIKYKTIGAAWSEYNIDNFVVESTTSIHENGSASFINVYPNPFKENSILFIDEKYSNSNYIVRINDMAGRKITEFYSEGRTHIPVAGEDIAAGTYLLNISKDGSIIENRKLIKE